PLPEPADEADGGEAEARDDQHHHQHHAYNTTLVGQKDMGEIDARLVVEVRRREFAERELDAALFRHRQELEEALSAERASAQDKLSRHMAAEHKKRDDLKVLA